MLPILFCWSIYIECIVHLNAPDVDMKYHCVASLRCWWSAIGQVSVSGECGIMGKAGTSATFVFAIDCLGFLCKIFAWEALLVQHNKEYWGTLEKSKFNGTAQLLVLLQTGQPCLATLCLRVLIFVIKLPSPFHAGLQYPVQRVQRLVLGPYTWLLSNKRLCTDTEGPLEVTVLLLLFYDLMFTFWIWDMSSQKCHCNNIRMLLQFESGTLQ